MRSSNVKQFKKKNDVIIFILNDDLYENQQMVAILIDDETILTLFLGVF